MWPVRYMAGWFATFPDHGSDGREISKETLFERRPGRRARLLRESHLRVSFESTLPTTGPPRVLRCYQKADEGQLREALESRRRVQV